MDDYEHYVYEVTLSDEVVYVGKGIGGRVNHVLSGKSHNKFINEAFFRSELLGEPPLQVKIVKWFPTSEEALSFESVMIGKLCPAFNIQQNPKISTVDTEYSDHFLWESITLGEIKDKLREEHQHYLTHSKDPNPHNLRWFVHSKTLSRRWEPYVELLNEFLEELIDCYVDKRGSNKGRPRKSLPDRLDMTKKERASFYYFQRTQGVVYSPESEEDIKYINSWLEDKRR